MKPVVFSETAKTDLERLLLYLEENWSIEVKHQFVNQLDIAIKTIVKFPEGFPSSSLKQVVRKCVVTEQTSLFYRIKKKEIEIIAIFDSRQDPLQLRL